MTGLSPGIVQTAAAAIFAVAVLHTFSTRYFQHLAHVNPSHAGLWHLLGEVEVVFGFWAMVLLLFLVAYSGTGTALTYLETRNFTEPAFVFVIMVIAASRSRGAEANIYNMPGTMADGDGLVAAIEAAVPEAAGLIDYEGVSLPFPTRIDSDGI